MNRKAKDEKEKELRDEMLTSQQQQNESVQQMKKELMEAINMQAEQVSLKARQQEEEQARKYESYVQ